MQGVRAGGMVMRVEEGGAVSVCRDEGPELRIEGLLPAVVLDGRACRIGRAVAAPAGDGPGCTATYAFEEGIELVLALSADPDGVDLRAVLRNTGPRDRVLNDVALLATGVAGGARFGAGPRAVRVMEQGNYWGRVRRIGEPPDAPRPSGEPNEPPATVKGASDNVWVAYDPATKRAFLAGFTTSERWQGRVECEAKADGTVTRWRIGFDGADVRLGARREVALEDAVFLCGDDPWRLLEGYGDRVAARHRPGILDTPPVSWCSWYPYRLGVTEERVLAEARIAAERLKPLGLSVVEVDLGWQAGNLPSTFEENERFPRGLKWLSDEVGKLGFRLGVWSAPYTISEFDPVVKAHPEYLIQGDDGKPVRYWTWFWEPHGSVHILDLTQPGAQAWLRGKMESLAARGVGYLKPDFIGCVARLEAKRRHDPGVASGGGTEAGRTGARIIREAMPDALVLNCGGPEMPGTGHLPLLYTCNDTGNTGFIPPADQRRNYHGVACHLWKNRRWGILQPSCLCVGLPGTIEDARLRATAAFLAGGQVDVSDTLTSLPEDRWDVLTATLPPLGATARPVDLFEPLPALPFDYEASSRGAGGADGPGRELPAGSVWHVRVEAAWDAWDLVGIFCWAEAKDGASGLTRFAVPFDRLGMPPGAFRWGYEFWSGQFLGSVPGRRVNPNGYAHPGDFQDLLCGDGPGTLDVAFSGPAAKLICLRERRPHPWPVGTSFHQSCGAELSGVAWDAAKGELRGEARRPAGEAGTVTVAAGGMRAVEAEVNGRRAAIRSGSAGAAGSEEPNAARSSVVMPVVMERDAAAWRIRFGPG